MVATFKDFSNFTELSEIRVIHIHELKKNLPYNAIYIKSKESFKERN